MWLNDTKHLKKTLYQAKTLRLIVFHKKVNT